MDLPAPPSQDPWTLTARWVFPVDRPPLEGGTVTIEGEHIAAVEPRGTRTPDHDLGNAALLPGLVNAHTHLDLSGLRGKCPPTSDFIDWLRAVIRHRLSTTPEETQADIQAGLAESMRFGTTLLGDISVRGASWSVLAAARLYSTIFYELLGLPREQVKEVAIAVTAWLRCHPPAANCRPAVSPHALYSTHQALFQVAASLAATSGLRLATHLAETREEIDLLANHSGRFADFLLDMGVWNPKGLALRLGQYIKMCRRHTPNLLLIHCNYLPSNQLIPPEGAIVFCPRTHAAFGHPQHPFPAFLARGVRVALGTDSLASNPDLDVLAEARFAHGRYPQVSGQAILRMATLAGAEALGWGEETGSITPGKSADLVVLPLPAEERHDPHLLVLESSLPVCGVLWRGRWRDGFPLKSPP